MSKLRTLLVGATGIAGQQFVSALREHPWFEITAVAASPRNAGKRYADAVASSWFLPEEIPPAIGALRLLDATQLDGKGFDLAFSAVEAEVARELEPRLAADIPVVSTANALRMDTDVPLLVPQVNAAHAPLLEAQQARGWQGVAPSPTAPPPAWWWPWRRWWSASGSAR